MVAIEKNSKTILEPNLLALIQDEKKTSRGWIPNRERASRLSQQAPSEKWGRGRMGEGER